MLDAKSRMLYFMAKSTVWPTAHTAALAAFFVELQMHPRTLFMNGKKALVLYQSRVRQEWFESNKGFKIEIIREDFLRSCADLINDQVWEEELEQPTHHQIRRMAYDAAYESPASRPSSSRRRRRERGREKFNRRNRNRTRSTSPRAARAESSRRRYRSHRSPSHHR
ncbi:hypothetical protein BJV77DRAFT_401361 [Russula vinacea]|nr:hypothetical protein BJV77DRAFT_401361 [Russula vinacea]